ncbi:MAG: homocysteine S-methyltransferase family protein [Gammaproteobacteria bacterium]|jgi:S-methylmethionine-dependent homocysteine/selenocysteine methylase|nr:homocysteine S-methyltransferase family protein [Gammaproteobacteria bacterium]MDP6653210.1 homocysteine S-methyltransferase family protein [Gammaproteobacteria bacterium]
MSAEKVMLLDAGMGKTLSMKGVEIPDTIWSANALIVAPEVVVEVHRENIEAGADIITTNSYGVIRGELAKENIEGRYKELNRMAGNLAERAVMESGTQTMIAGSLPPQNGSYRPDRVMSRESIEPLYREQVALLDPHVDLFICETMSTIEEAVTAATIASESGKPVFVGLTLHDEQASCLRSGESIEDALEQLLPLNLQGLLANCCLPERISDAMPSLVSGGFDYCGGYANAFAHVPRDWLLDGDKDNDGRLALREDLCPEIYCDFVEGWIDQGANIVGGCCGTTAAHTRAISSLLATKPVLT